MAEIGRWKPCRRLMPLTTLRLILRRPMVFVPGFPNLVVASMPSGNVRDGPAMQNTGMRAW